MLTLGQKIREARKKSNLKQSDIANALNIKNTTVSNWEKDISKPDIDTIEYLCHVFNVSASYFIDDLASNEILSISEKEVIKKYRVLDEHGKDLVDTILLKEYDRCVKEPEYTYVTKSIDKYPRLASAGHGEYVFEDIPIERVEVEENSQADFAIGIYGDSMEPTFSDGETVLVKKQEYLSIGDIGIFIADGDSFIKEYGGDRLISHNKKYEDILFNENMDIRVVGKVIGKLN